MSNQISKNFPEVFLIEFTRGILRATDSYRKNAIKGEVRRVVERRPIKIVERRRFALRPDINKIVRNKIDADSSRISALKKEENPFAEFFRKQQVKKIHPVLIIPETKLPINVQHIRPVPTPMEIDLRKLNVLVNDPLVKIIECNGPNEKIVVMGSMGRKHTPLTLSKEEIDGVISKFSEASKIPASEGIYKVVFGKLVLNAIISEVIGSKFIIRKMGI